MPCRVGITRNPERRKAEWEREVVGLRNWREEFVGSKSEAQTLEFIWQIRCEQIGNHGQCHAHPGGGDPDAWGWYVYEFDYVHDLVR